MLDIIVTHYREPWEIVRPFFDMLGVQRGICFDDIRVILVHDGTEPFSEDTFSRYPYRVEQHSIPHGGVSAARNYGLDRATAEWVEFCDCDDMYTHIYALRSILPQLKHDVDFAWTPFFEEQDADGKLAVMTMERQNIIFIHGKYFRREFLKKNGIRFPEWIHFSEDSAFCTIVNEVAKKRGKISTNFPAYVWATRPDSVSNAPENRAKNLTGFIDRNFFVVEDLKRRGINHIPMVGRMFADAYWAFHQVDKFPEEEARFAAECGKYLADLDRNNVELLEKILLCAVKAFKPQDIDRSRESFTKWIMRIRKAG